MTRTLTAHFDGHALIPEGPIDLPLGTKLTLTVETPAGRNPSIGGPSRSIEERLAALDELFALVGSRANLPDETLRRESIYGDDGK